LVFDARRTSTKKVQNISAACPIYSKSDVNDM
jgi:hypothetical protein